MRKVDWQHEAAGSRHLAEKAPARTRGFVGIPIENRRPARLPALQRVMHEVANDHRMLSARADIDAAMARRMPGRRRQPERVVERKIVVNKERLTGRDHRLAVEAPDVAAAAGARL